MLNINKNKKGFTLIELLVVIAIIGTLSSIAVIAFTKSSQGAQDAAMLGQMDRVIPLINLCISFGDEVCSDCTDSFTYKDILQDRSICQGETWPASVKGWKWWRFSTSNSFGLDPGEWLFSARRLDESLFIICTNSQGDAKCDFATQ